MRQGRLIATGAMLAFCLFALTFVLNTFAEVVRQRFRKRAYQL